MDLTTQCPQCGATFSANLDQLQLRKGYIRCLHCAHIFDGYEAVVPSSGAASPAKAPVSDAGRRPVPDPISTPVPTSTPASTSDSTRDSTRDSTPASGGRVPAYVSPAPYSASAAPSGPVEHSVPESVPETSDKASDPVPAGIVRLRTAQGQGPAAAPPEIRVPRFTISAAAPGKAETTPEPVISIGTLNRQTARADARPEPIISRGQAVVSSRTDNHRQSRSQPVYISDEAAQRPTVYIEPRGDADEDEPELLPEFLDDGYSRSSGIARVFWGVLVLIGLVAILGQLVYVYRVPIASSIPATRPILEQVCEALNCQVPYPRRIELISIMSSSLQAVAQPGKAKKDESLMTLQLTLRNNYDRPQQWPTLTLDLVEFSGTVVVKKVLTPKDYLPVQALPGPFAATSEIRITVPITVTGFKINGYQLNKFFP